MDCRNNSNNNNNNNCDNDVVDDESENDNNDDDDHHGGSLDESSTMILSSSFSSRKVGRTNTTSTSSKTIRTNNGMPWIYKWFLWIVFSCVTILLLLLSLEQQQSLLSTTTTTTTTTPFTTATTTSSLRWVDPITKQHLQTKHDEDQDTTSSDTRSILGEHVRDNENIRKQQQQQRDAKEKEKEGEETDSTSPIAATTATTTTTKLSVTLSLRNKNEERRKKMESKLKSKSSSTFSPLSSGRHSLETKPNSLVNFTNVVVPSRAFSFPYTVPCYLPTILPGGHHHQQQQPHEVFRKHPPINVGGLFLIRPTKCGSSTAVAVNIRMAYTLAKEQLSRLRTQPQGNSTTSIINLKEKKVDNIPTNHTTTTLLTKQEKQQRRRRQRQNKRVPSTNTTNLSSLSSLPSPLLPPLCSLHVRHSKGTSCRNRNTAGGSFLWSIVRQPTPRFVSNFYFFSVGRNGMNPYDFDAFQRQAQRTGYNPLIRQLSFQPLSKYASSDGQQRTKGLLEYNTNTSLWMEQIESILNDYDFIAVMERMDESIVALQLLLGLDTTHVLFMSAKTSKYDDGATGKCIEQVPKNLTSDFEEFLQSDEWKMQTQGDVWLHEAVNKSLDLTIEQLGRQRFDVALQTFRFLQGKIKEECVPDTVFPCSPDGVYSAQTQCLFQDTGCNMECIDRVAEKYGGASSDAHVQ